MRVLHIQKVSGVGGSERHLLTLLPALAARGVDVEFLSLNEANASDFTDQMRATGIPTHEVPAGPDLNPANVHRITRLINRTAPDLVHTHLIHADLHGQTAAALTHTRGVNSVHSTHRFLRRQPVRLAARWANSRSCHTIAISEHVRRFIVEHQLAQSDAVTTIHYGIDVEAWRAASGNGTGVRADLGINADDFVACMAARLIPGKGHVDVLAALGRLIQRNRASPIHLIVAGSGPLNMELRSAATRCGIDDRVTFLGHVSNIAHIMAASDVLLFPTRAELGEGFGLAALEAMAIGKPVIATNVGALPEVIVDNETGLLVEPGRPESIEQAVLSLMQDGGPHSRMANAAYQRAKNQFDASTMVDRTLRLYQDMIQG